MICSGKSIALESNDDRRGPNQRSIRHTNEFGEFGMNVIADICVIPLGVGLSVSEHVAACERIFEKAGLNPQLHAYGTNVEGSWDDVMAALKQCHETVHEMGAPRISTTIRLGTRTDRAESLRGKIESVEEKLSGQPPKN